MTVYTNPTTPASVWAARPPRGATWNHAPRPPQPTPPQPTPPQYTVPVHSWARPPLPSRPTTMPPWNQPPAPRTAATLHRWLPIGMALSAVVLAFAAILVTAVDSRQSAQTTSPTTSGASAGMPSPQAASPEPAPPTLVREETLPALLLDVATIDVIMGSDLAVNPALTTDRLYSDTTDKPDCGGSWANANKGEYSGSGWQSVRTQYLREPNRPQHEVYQSVVSFPGPQAAKDFVAKEADRWPSCTGTAVTTTNATTPAQTWWIASVSRDADMVTAVSSREGASGYKCQHTVTSRNNVVVDVVACGWDVTEQGTTIARRVAEQITRTL
jgi:hypothetical protein